MKILIVATGDFYSKPNPSFHLLTSLIRDLLDSGHKIHLIGMEEEGVEKHIPDDFLISDSFSYSLVKSKKIKKSKFILRFIDGISYSYKIRKYLKKQVSHCDVIFVRSSPTIYFNLKSVRKYTTNQKVIYGVQDMFPGSTIASGKMNNRLLQSFFYWLQKRAYKKADIITAISNDMKTKLLEQGVSEEKIKVIVNWYDDKTVEEIPYEDNLFIKKYNMDKNKFYVQYAGTMGYVFDYKMVLDVAVLLKNDPDIIFQMIGAGSQKDDFILEAEKRELSNIHFLPLEPQEMVSHVYSACSVCFIPLKKGIIGNSVPSKAGLLMACRRPIITTADEGSDYNAMINNNNAGYAFSCDEADKVADSILYLKSNPEKVRELGINGFKYGSLLYSRTENTKKYIKLFEECI